MGEQASPHALGRAGETPRLVVLGCGFAGYSLLSRLAGRRLRAPLRATLVSPRNYFLFTPLLPSAVSGTVEPRSILEPARRRLRHSEVLDAEAVSFDGRRRRVTCRSQVTGETFEVPFDLLVIAVGARVDDYGIPGVAEHTLQLADVEDARRIRGELLARFAAADVPGLGEEELRRRMRMVVCGGGPTGVEVAAEIQDLLHRELVRLYPELAPRASVVLLEAMERILGGFHQALADYASGHFRREGIDVRTDSKVVEIDAQRVHLAGGESIPYGMVVWAGGNTSNDLVSGLGAPLARGRLVVDEHLRLQGEEDIYAAGDCAALGDPVLPATAQVAQQQGKYLARALVRRLEGREVPPFHYRPLGMLAYIGAGRALADLPRAQWKGRSAWLFWRSVYLTKLVSWSNKAKVLFDWIKARVFGRDLSRL